MGARAAIVLLLLWAAVPTPLQVEDQARYPASQGLVEMTPAIRLPTTKDDTQRITVWLHIPPGARIETLLTPDGRPVLRMPEGTRADRVEYQRCPPPGERGCWSVLDVRGTRFEDSGGELFHVLLPVEDTPHAALRGAEWARGDRRAEERATARLVELLGSPRRHGITDTDVRTFREQNDCAHCHEHARPAERFPGGDGRPERPTDASGLFTPLMVLTEWQPVSRARSLDLNARDPFVDVRCGDAAARFVDGEFTCPDGSVPRARRNIRAGLAAHDAYTERVCASRQHLFDHLDDVGRRAFAESFRACGIAPR